MDRKTFQRKEYPTVIAFLVLSGIACIESWKLFRNYPGPEQGGFYPLLVSAGMLLFCLLSLIELMKKAKTLEKDGNAEEWGQVLSEEVPRNTWIMALFVVGYVLLFWRTNFYLATGLFLMISISFMGKSRGKDLIKNLGISLASLALVWLVMEKIFSIHLSM